MDCIMECKTDSKTEQEVCITSEPISIHNELKKLTVLERVQLLNKIRQEEEHEEQEKMKVLDQAENKGCKQMNINTNAILQELRNLRIQIQEIKYEVQYLHKNQQKTQKQLLCEKSDEYNCDDSFSIISLISDWIPIWIFFVFVVFALSTKPSRLCPISGSISSSGGGCPISGLGNLGDFITKL